MTPSSPKSSRCGLLPTIVRVLTPRLVVDRPGRVAFRDLDWGWYLLIGGLAMLATQLFLSARGTKPDVREPIPPQVLELTHADLTETARSSSPFGDEDDRRADREQLSLRGLTPLEVGLPVRQTPPGTFFFQSASIVGYWNSNFGSSFTVSGMAVYRDTIELHRMHDNRVFAVGYCSPEAARKLRDVDADFDLQLFAIPWADRTVRVRAPLDRATAPRHREFQHGDILEMHVSPNGPGPGGYEP